MQALAFKTGKSSTMFLHCQGARTFKVGPGLKCKSQNYLPADLPKGDNSKFKSGVHQNFLLLPFDLCLKIFLSLETQ